MKKKVIIGAVVLIALAAVVFLTVSRSNRSAATVTTTKVGKADVTSVVTASGQIKPLQYVNIGANAFGKITKLYVAEGQRVKRGQMLAQLENVQSEADVAGQRAGVNASQMEAQAAIAGSRTAEADLNRAKADAEKARLDYQRAEGLYRQQLISKQEYDTRKAAAEVADAALAQSQARVAQANAQAESAAGRVNQASAGLRRASDLLNKTTYIAPFEGTITNLPVREGETVVVGIQNSPGSTLMTLADLSVITAEVKVDETDIVNVQLGQPAEVKIDAIPDKTFQGKVTEIGNNAILRSTGVATTQTTGGTTEAKDFKVVITLSEPPANLRPGLSTTAKITTATRQNVLTVPIQALTIRNKEDLEKPKPGDKGAVQAAAPQPRKGPREEIQGVFVVRADGRNKKAEFVPVKTGITGSTEIEVLGGLKEGDEVITGSYRVLRTLKPEAPVKVDNKLPVREEEKS